MVVLLLLKLGRQKLQHQMQNFMFRLQLYQAYDKIKLLRQLEEGFLRKINQNKYQSKVSIERQNKYLYYLIDASFQVLNRLFASSLEN